MKTYDLKSIQKRGLAILLDVDKVCAEHKIQYFLDGGTLIGAVRHKGFIPWDDDIDLSMPRDDYEKFLEIAPNELSDRYFVQAHQTDSEFPFGFARIIDKKSRTIDGDKVKFRTGFCIDVFPIDNAHDNMLVHKFRIFLIKVIQLLTKDKVDVKISDYPSVSSKIAIAIGIGLGRLFPARQLMHWQRKIAIRSNSTSTKNKCVYSYSVRALRFLLPADIYQQTVMLEFEGHLFPAPGKWDELLTIIYGDYMTPPSEEKRVPMHGYNNVQFFE